MSTALAAGAHGPAVATLQRNLLLLGYPLPRWGVDGELGAETLGALAMLLADHGRTPAEVPGEVTTEDLALIADLVARRVATADLRLFDVRAGSPATFVIGARPWSSVTGITLHQTACVLGDDPRRWRTIGAHVGVTREGRVIWIHDFTKLVIHGNWFNGATVGVELDGMYAGVEGDPDTFWRPRDQPGLQPQRPTPELVAAARGTIRWIVAQVAAHGGSCRNLFAHRQASADRRADPGSALWHEVAIPMMAELGLSDGGPGYKVGGGAPIPREWDQSRSDPY